MTRCYNHRAKHDYARAVVLHVEVGHHVGDVFRTPWCAECVRGWLNQHFATFGVEAIESAWHPFELLWPWWRHAWAWLRSPLFEPYRAPKPTIAELLDIAGGVS